MSFGWRGRVHDDPKIMADRCAHPPRSRRIVRKNSSFDPEFRGHWNRQIVGHDRSQPQDQKHDHAGVGRIRQASSHRGRVDDPRRPGRVSIQMAIRDHFIRLGQISLQRAFVVMETKDSGTYFFGDIINEGIVSPHPKQLALWSFVGGAAQHVGAKELPNLEDIFAHVARSIGTPQFGLPRLPPENALRERPIDLLNKFWNPVRNYMALNVQSAGLWPFVLGNSTQLAIIEARDVIDPALAAKIVMEVAIPMSKVNPRLIFHAEIGTRTSPEPSPTPAKSPDVAGRAFEEQSAPRRVFGRRQTPP